MFWRSSSGGAHSHRIAERCAYRPIEFMATFNQMLFLARIFPSTLLLAGCLVTAGPRPETNPVQQSFPYNKKYPEKFTVNGNLPIRQGAQLNNPAVSYLPPVTSQADIEALAKLTKTMMALAMKYARSGDVQSYVETWYLAQLLATYSLQLELGSRALADSLRNDGSGKILATLPPKSVAILPIDQAVGDIDVALPPSAKSPESLGGQAPKTLTNTHRETAGAVVDEFGGALPTGLDGLKALPELPERLPAKLPNGVELYRNGGILYFVNPSTNRVDVPISDAGWVPPNSVTSETTTIDVARIKIAMNTNLNAWFWNKVNSWKVMFLQCRINKPGYASCSDGSVANYSKNGSWALSQNEYSIAAKEYAKRPQTSFGIAVDEMSKTVPEVESFRERCVRAERTGYQSGDMKWAVDSQLSGSRAQILTSRCWGARRGDRNGFKLVYAQQFVMENGKLLRTEASLLEDNRLKERLRASAALNKVAQDMVNLVPGLSNAENGFKCAGGAEWSPTAFLIDAYSSTTMQPDALDKMAAHFVGGLPPPDFSTVDHALSCLSALPRTAKATGGAWVIAKAKPAYEAAAAKIATALGRQPGSAGGQPANFARITGGAGIGEVLKIKDASLMLYHAKQYSDSASAGMVQTEPYVALLASQRTK